MKGISNLNKLNRKEFCTDLLYEDMVFTENIWEGGNTKHTMITALCFIWQRFRTFMAQDLYMLSFHYGYSSNIFLEKWLELKLGT